MAASQRNMLAVEMAVQDPCAESIQIGSMADISISRRQYSSPRLRYSI